MTLRQILLTTVIVCAIVVLYTHPAGFSLYGPMLGMAIVVKDVTASAQKYATRAGAAVNDYKTGVQAAGQKWHDNTKSSTDNYSAGVQASIANGSFGKGIDKAGPDRYATRASTKGAAAYPAGVQAGQQRWAQNVQPFFQVLQSATLPPRGPKGDPRNQQRAQFVADLLRKKKVNG